MESKKQQQQAARRKQEDTALNRLLIWFAVAVGYEALILLIRRFYISLPSTDAGTAVALGFFRVFSVLWWLAPVLTAAALVWLCLWHRKGKPVRVPAITAAVLAVLSLTAVLSYFFYTDGVDLLSALAPVAAVLAMVYYLYQREFFCNTVITGCGILCLWVYRRFFSLHPTMVRLGYVLAWVLLAAAAVAAWKLFKSGGRWRKRRLFPDGISYVPTWVTCGLTAVTLAAALLGGATIAFYAIFVLVIWLFCMAVYYTVRLM